MQLNIETDYAVRCVLYLAQCGKYTPVVRIGEQMRIEEDTLSRIIALLCEAGVVETRKIPHSCRLAREPEKISVLDILELMEGTIKINRCLEHDGYCNRSGRDCNCPVHRYYSGVQNMLEQVFGDTSFADLLNGKADAFRALV